MKILLLFPPQLTPEHPYLSIPLLAGQLKKHNFDVKCIDLNIKFYNKVLSKEYLSALYETIEDKVLSKNNQYSDEKQRLLLEYINKYKARKDIFIKYIDKAVEVYKNSNLFFNEKILFKANKIINYAFEFISLAFYPLKLSFDIESNPDFKLDYEKIKQKCYDEENNIYINFYKSIFNEIKNEKPDIIAISVPFAHQIYSAFTLSRIIKENLDIPIVIGGNIFSRVSNAIKKHTEIFDLFADYFLLGDGEISIVQFMNYMKNKQDINDVNGLMYINSNNELVLNKIVPIKNIKEVAPPNFDDYNFKEYFSPIPIIPLQFSKGCYWGKCSFCDFFHGKPYFSTFSPSEAVSIIEKMINDYNVYTFDIKDEAISAGFYEKFADEIIARNLKIKYFSFCRLEKSFTSKVLKKLKQSGLYEVFWGVGAVSNRIINLMNKGIDNNYSPKILKAAANAGIVNRVGFLIGFPSEEYNEALQTLNFYKKYKKYIHTCSIEKYRATRHSKVIAAPQSFKMKNFSENGEFCEFYSSIYEGMTELEKDKIMDLFYSEVRKSISNKFLKFFYSNSAPYIIKYGEGVLNRKYDIRNFK